MVNWYLGTMGFSYKDWSGPFYPPYVEQRDYLAHYSRIFNAVEIDSSFYGTPRPETVTRWAEMTPPDFTFCAKLPRIITHDKKLVGAEPELRGFLDVMSLLGDKLGVLLIQMPPSFTAVEKPALTLFLESLPPGFRFALEVRHQSWHQDEPEELLARHKVAWAATEYEDLPKRIANTAGFLYVRFIGRHGRFQSHESERLDVTENLKWWKTHLQAALPEVDAVYGFFNNDYAGFAPGSLNRFKELAGLPASPFTPPQQPRLFE